MKTVRQGVQSQLFQYQLEVNNFVLGGPGTNVNNNNAQAMGNGNANLYNA